MKVCDAHANSCLPDLALGERVVALARYFGQGKRSTFVRQVVRKADQAVQLEEWIAEGGAWQIYNRLCDFALIYQNGQLTDVSWQWGGDRVTVLRSNEAVVPRAIAEMPPYKSLFPGLTWHEHTMYESPQPRGHGFALRYWVSNRADLVLARLRQEQLPIDVTFSTSFLPYLASAQDVFRRLASPIRSVPSDEELERRECFNDGWLPIDTPPGDNTFLLRRARRDGPGYQYWLVANAINRSYEIRSTDWTPLLLWWIGKRRWPLRYLREERSLFIPTRLFYAFPALLRQALILPRMRWPSFSSDGKRENLRFEDFSFTDVSSLARLYEPALEINYAG